MKKFATKNLYDEANNLSKEDRLCLLTSLALESDTIGTDHPEIYKSIPTEDELYVLNALRPYSDVGGSAAALIGELAELRFGEEVIVRMLVSLQGKELIKSRKHFSEIFWFCTNLGSNLISSLHRLGYWYADDEEPGG